MIIHIFSVDIDNIESQDEVLVQNGEKISVRGEKEPEPLTEQFMDDCMTVCPKIENMSKRRPLVNKLVVVAGFFSNIVTKGVMKAVGFIFKAIMDHIEGLSPMMGSLFPTIMHLFFNCICKSLKIKNLDTREFTHSSIITLKL